MIVVERGSRSRHNDLNRRGTGGVGRDRIQRIVLNVDGRAAARRKLHRFNGGSDAADIVETHRATGVEEGDAGSERHVADNVVGDQVPAAFDRTAGKHLDAASIGVLHGDVLHREIVQEKSESAVGDDTRAEVMVARKCPVLIAVDRQILDRDAATLNEEAIRHRAAKRAVRVAVGDGRTNHHARLRLPVNR